MRVDLLPNQPAQWRLIAVVFALQAALLAFALQLLGKLPPVVLPAQPRADWETPTALGAIGLAFIALPATGLVLSFVRSRFRGALGFFFVDAVFCAMTIILFLFVFAYT